MTTSTTSSTAPSTAPFERGAALTAVLAVAILQHAVVVTLLVTAWSQDTAQGQQPTLVLLPSAAGAVITLVAYAGLWTGHRWAFWLFVAMSAIAAVTRAAVGAPLPLQLVQVAAAVLVTAAVLRRWSHFG